jgi:hypothetical protein
MTQAQVSWHVSLLLTGMNTMSKVEQCSPPPFLILARPVHTPDFLLCLSVSTRLNPRGLPPPSIPGSLPPWLPPQTWLILKPFLWGVFSFSPALSSHSGTCLLFPLSCPTGSPWHCHHSHQWVSSTCRDRSSRSLPTAWVQPFWSARLGAKSLALTYITILYFHLSFVVSSILFVSISQMRKVRLSRVQDFAQRHTSSVWF